MQDHQVLLANPQMSPLNRTLLVPLVLRTVSQDPAEVTSAASSASRCSKISMFERQLKKAVEEIVGDIELLNLYLKQVEI